MVMWRLKKIYPQPISDVMLECEAGITAMTAELEDTDTGDVGVITFCQDMTLTDPCELLTALTGSGYTPNDWTAGCT